MSEFSSEDEFIRQELTWMANFLRKNFKLNRRKIRRKIREMLDVTV